MGRLGWALVLLVGVTFYFLGGFIISNEGKVERARLEQTVKEEFRALSTALQERKELGQCERVPVYYPSEGGMLYKLGETAVCAKGNRLVTFHYFLEGPVLVEQDALATAWEEANRWEGCAKLLTLCPEGFERGNK